MEELNKNTPEDETTEETAETVEVPETEETVEISETEEVAEVPEADEDSVAVSVAEIGGETPSRPAGMLRSAITAVVVLAVFAAVYFIYTAFNPEEEKTEPKPSTPKTEMSISENQTGGEKAPETTDGEKKSATNASENKTESNVQVVTGEEEASPEYTAATDKITAEARKKYGENVMVLPEYNSQLKTVKIGGGERKCYMAAAVKIDPTQESGTQIIHAAHDPETGEIWFDDTDTWEVLD